MVFFLLRVGRAIIYSCAPGVLFPSGDIIKWQILIRMSVSLGFWMFSVMRTMTADFDNLMATRKHAKFSSSQFSFFEKSTVDGRLGYR